MVAQPYSSEVVLTDVSSKEQSRQLGVGMVVTSGDLGGVMVVTLPWNASYADLIPALGAIFPIFITLMTLVAVTMILSIQDMRCMVAEPIL